jgi:hypothetical protein
MKGSTSLNAKIRPSGIFKTILAFNIYLNGQILASLNEDKQDYRNQDSHLS